MTAEYDLTDLVQLSRTLGEPARRLAILAEGARRASRQRSTCRQGDRTVVAPRLGSGLRLE